MDKAEATADVQQRQDENTAALVMNTFYKVASEGSATVEDITKYLLDKFGDVWQVMKNSFSQFRHLQVVVAGQANRKYKSSRLGLRVKLLAINYKLTAVLNEHEHLRK